MYQPGPRVQALEFWCLGFELTQIKCYRDGAMDGASDDTLTHIRGYPSPEHEFIC